jgi:general secretion pathway protein D
VRKFWRRASGAFLILTLIAGCAAERLHREGLAAIERGDYEIGVADLSQAVAHDPGNIAYRLDFQSRRESALLSLIAEADAARRAAQLDGAAALYRRVLSIDPANDRARHGLEGIEGDKRHGSAVAEARKDFEHKDYDAAEAKVRAILNEDPGYVPAQELGGEITVARGPVTVAPRLQTRDHHKVTLQLRDAPTKMVFEVLQRETSINFILDKDVKSDSKTTIFVQDVPVEEAIDLVLDQNALARQILSANMVLIYPNSPAKQKDYQEEIVRTFYLTNAAPKDAESMLKSVLGAKTLFVDERANLVVMRDTPDAVRMAEKLVASLDVAEPEVMLEVEVLEIDKTRLQDLGISYPTGATLATPSGLVLSDLRHQSSHTISVTPLSVTLNALKQAGLTNTLASPRIRARNKEKAKILIGSRVPVITNSVALSGAASVPTTNVQYLDVGLTLEVQPTIHLDSDVAIKVALEVSSIVKEVDITAPNGGTTVAYQIGTRNANTLLRLKDGETQVLAGLIQDQDTHNFNSIPGLGDIPGVGRLFGTSHTNREKDEVVLSITPRIIRMQTRPASDSTEFWYGTETRTRSAPYGPAASTDREPGTAPALSLPGTATQTPSSAAPRSNPVPPSPQGLPITAPPAGITPSAPAVASPPASGSAGPEGTAPAPTGTPAAEGTPSSSVPTPLGANAGAAASALTLEGPSSARVGDEFQVVLRLSAGDSITRLRSQVRFDGTALQLISATNGDVVPSTAASPTVDSRGGKALLEVVTTPDQPVQGNGGLMVLRFKALQPRASTSVAAQVSVLGSAGAAVGNSAAAPLNLAIQ